FNQKKSAVIDFSLHSMDDEANRSTIFTLQNQDIEMSNRYKYLGVVLTNEENYLKENEKNLRNRAVKQKHILHAKALWSFSRYQVLRSTWKAVAVPALTFANAVLTYEQEFLNFLDVQQREVARLAIGCHGFVAREFVEGEFSCSAFNAREAVSKFKYRVRLE